MASEEARVGIPEVRSEESRRCAETSSPSVLLTPFGFQRCCITPFMMEHLGSRFICASLLKTVLFECRREDSGLLVYKEHLPVSQVAVGDTNRPGSEAKMTVGPLRCQGDSKSYNATTIYLMLQPVGNKQTTLPEFQVCPWDWNQEHCEQESGSFCCLEAKGWYDRHKPPHWW